VRNRLDILVWRFKWQIIKCTLTYQGLIAARRVRLRESDGPVCMHVPSMGLDKKRRPWIRFESFFKVCLYTCPLLTKLHNIWDEYLMQCHFYMCPQEWDRETCSHHVCGWTKLMFDYFRNATWFFRYDIQFCETYYIWLLILLVCVGGIFYFLSMLLSSDMITN